LPKYQKARFHAANNAKSNCKTSPMKNQFIVVLLFSSLLQLLSCKKDSQPGQLIQPQNHGLENGIVNFSANGELVGSVIDTTTNTILVTVLNQSAEQTVTVNFTLANQVAANVNNQPINSGAVIDLSNPVEFTIKSVTGPNTTTFRLVAQTELGYFGLGGAIISQNSLTRDYEFYFDQFDGSAFQLLNCGPATTTMAIKWADSTFTKKPVDARNTILPQGGWWFTGNVSSYLTQSGIRNTTDTLSNLDSLVKARIDNNNALILCLDMFYVTYNPTSNQHVQKFYATAGPGWGHFILIKGYVQLGDAFYLEAYDPYSDGSTYTAITPGQLKGKSRYYLDDDIKLATNIWWPYAIILGPKGQPLEASTKLQLNSLGKPKIIPQAYGR
jgi:hypothetical protein